MVQGLRAGKDVQSLYSASVSGLIWNRQGSTTKLLEIVRTIFPGEVEQMMDSFGRREKNVLMCVWEVKFIISRATEHG